MLSAEVFDARLPRANLVTKTDFDDKLNVLSNKLTQIEQNIFLVENESKKLQIFHSICICYKGHFEVDDTQTYLVFQPMYRYFKRVSNVGDDIYFSKSKRL